MNKCTFTGCNNTIRCSNKYKGSTAMCIECRRMALLSQHIKQLDEKINKLICCSIFVSLLVYVSSGFN